MPTHAPSGHERRNGARRRFLALLPLAGSLGLVAACDDLPVALQCPPAPDAAVFAAAPKMPAASPYDALFAAAGDEFGVPQSLLKAIGYVETRWQMVEGHQEFPGRPPAFGIMALRGERLERGAAFAGVPIEAARRDPAANIRAAAALLDAYADGTAIERSRPDAWASVLARFSGIELPEGRESYVRDGVYRVLGHGLSGRAAAPAGFSASISASVASNCPGERDDSPKPGGAPDYAGALWRPSPNYDQRPADETGVIHEIVIHTCEGSYAGCWSWLVNPVSQVSVHYVVDEDGAEIAQLVRDADRAWHIAALYDCSLNHRHDCGLDGVQSNHFTIGIEHAGYASQASFPASQIDASAALACEITRNAGIPRDWQHIVAHGRLQPENRTDPGANWPWVEYITRIQRYCGEIVVDDDVAYNDPAAAKSAAPGGWFATDQTPGYYGGGYRWASTTEAEADGVAFSFHLDAPATRTLDARWTAGTNRSPAAAFVVLTADGDTLATVRVDQRTGGGRWHELGSWSFPAGWNRVVLSREGAPGAVVVADAVRVRAP